MDKTMIEVKKFLEKLEQVGRFRIEIERNEKSEIYKITIEGEKTSETTIIMEEEEAEKNENKDIKTKITEQLIMIGVPAHIRGYNYVRTAIEMVVMDPKEINAITKGIYPNVAKKYETTSSRVERAIRHAIEVTWQKGNMECINEIFGYTISDIKGKPTNSEFIAHIADLILTGIIK